jgi:hypothetical protein
MSDSAICPTTMTLRAEKRRPRIGDPSDVSAFKSATRSVFDSFSAGPRPASTVAITAKATVAVRTTASGRGSNAMPSGSTAASDRASAPVAHDDSSSPPAAPASASSRPSVSSCRTIRPRPPPTASLIAISLRRADPRASSMLAMFNDAISRTTPDRPIRSADIAAGPESVEGDVLVLSLGSGLTVSSCSLFSAG